MFSNDGLFLIINHHSISFIVVSNKSSVLFFSFSIQLGYSRQTKTERTELFLKNILSWSGFFTICHLSFDFYIRDLLCWYEKKKLLSLRNGSRFYISVCNLLKVDFKQIRLNTEVTTSLMTNAHQVACNPNTLERI